MELRAMCQKAYETKRMVGTLDTETKNKVLYAAADALLANEEAILKANETDIENAKNKGMETAMIDRLRLNHTRICDMADGLRQVAKLNDPIGEVLTETTRPNGLVIKKVRVALGVVGIIYESRPNVTCDAFGLCFKTGNCVVLKGGSDAICSNTAIVTALKTALKENDISEYALNLIESTDRETTTAFMKMKEYVDVLIPRGGKGLISNVVANATIPVIETGVGNCHVYVDEQADLDMAVSIVTNAKTQRVSVCNACESLLVHKNILDSFLPKLQSKLMEKQVELRADEESYTVLENSFENAEGNQKDTFLKKASEADWGTEYLDYVLSIKTVANVEEAISHINQYNTAHSEAIVTENCDTAQKFLNEVDA
ncbi:MAG: glutamate-5-semialdehyde dehydrogenase, partial [Lachnospiraceae bacterium]|nr:glutamate-5-semialdehyde dehydrogenase [Lachnospiraceae bacterium]